MNLFDAHCHIIDPRFPLKANHGFLPESFTADMYKKKIKPFNIQGGAVVSGSFQGFDQTYLIQALKTLGPNFVGVTNLPPETADETVIKLFRQGIRGVRFNLFRGGVELLPGLLEFGQHIYQLCGMHIELYIDGDQLNQYIDQLIQLPKISIDHLGLSSVGFQSLQRLVEKGARVKATGFMRVDFDVIDAMRTLHSINPHALMFGTDLPGTRANRTFDQQDLDLIKNHFSPSEQERIFKSNATHFYGIKIA